MNAIWNGYQFAPSVDGGSPNPPDRWCSWRLRCSAIARFVSWNAVRTFSSDLRSCRPASIRSAASLASLMCRRRVTCSSSSNGSVAEPGKSLIHLR